MRENTEKVNRNLQDVVFSFCLIDSPHSHQNGAWRARIKNARNENAESLGLSALVHSDCWNERRLRRRWRPN